MQPPSILVDWDPVDSVSTFTYLGSLQSSDGYYRPDIRRRITLASSEMSSLDCIWKERRLRLPSKYVFTLLSSSPSYSMPPRHGLSLQQMSSLSLNAFHMECQRIILRISWRQFVRNSEISALTGLPAINYVIRHRRIAVFGHIAT